MDFTLFLWPVLRPFTDWCIISASWYTVKYFINHEYITNKFRVKWYQTLAYMVCIMAPATLITAFISAIIYESVTEVSMYLAVVGTSGISVLFYVSKHNAKSYARARKLAIKEGLIKK
jgi:hypothetical protein